MRQIKKHAAGHFGCSLARNRQIMLMISDNYEFAKDSAAEAAAAGNGSCNQGEIVARQARMTFGANAVRCLRSVLGRAPATSINL